MTVQTPSITTKLFASAREDMDRVASELGGTLQATFKLRDSSYLGEYYLAKDCAPLAQEVRLFLNKDPIDGRPIRDVGEPGKLVLEASSVGDMDALAAAIGSLGFELSEAG